VFVRVTSGLPPGFKSGQPHEAFQKLLLARKSGLRLPEGVQSSLHRHGETGAFFLTFPSAAQAAAFMSQKASDLRARGTACLDISLDWARLPTRRRPANSPGPVDARASPSRPKPPCTARPPAKRSVSAKRSPGFEQPPAQPRLTKSKGARGSRQRSGEVPEQSQARPPPAAPEADLSLEPTLQEQDHFNGGVSAWQGGCAGLQTLDQQGDAKGPGQPTADQPRQCVSGTGGGQATRSDSLHTLFPWDDNSEEDLVPPLLNKRRLRQPRA
jgi:hypothetical protein